MIHFECFNNFLSGTAALFGILAALGAYHSNIRVAEINAGVQALEANRELSELVSDSIKNLSQHNLPRDVATFTLVYALTNNDDPESSLLSFRIIERSIQESISTEPELREENGLLNQLSTRKDIDVLVAQHYLTALRLDRILEDYKKPKKLLKLFEEECEIATRFPAIDKPVQCDQPYEGKLPFPISYRDRASSLVAKIVDNFAAERDLLEEDTEIKSSELYTSNSAGQGISKISNLLGKKGFVTIHCDLNTVTLEKATSFYKSFFDKDSKWLAPKFIEDASATEVLSFSTIMYNGKQNAPLAKELLVDINNLGDSFPFKSPVQLVDISQESNGTSKVEASQHKLLNGQVELYLVGK